MRIGILGSGLMDSKLGTIFARAGHDVIFSYSRTRQKLETLAKGAGAQAHVGTPSRRDARRRVARRPLDACGRCIRRGGHRSGQSSADVLLAHEQRRLAHSGSGIPIPVRKAWRLRFQKHMWYPCSLPSPARCCFQCSRGAGRENRRT